MEEKYSVWQITVGMIKAIWEEMFKKDEGLCFKCKKHPADPEGVKNASPELLKFVKHWFFRPEDLCPECQKDVEKMAQIFA